MLEGLILYLENHTSLDQSEKNSIKELISVREVEKSDLLLAEGEVSSEFYFVLSGGIRLFYTLDTIEKTAFFYFENSFVSSYESYTRQTPSKHSLQAIEDSVIAVISSDVAAKLISKHPKFESLARIMMEEELIVYQEIISTFVTLSPEERYLNILQSNPKILQRIPQHQLATYLGITAETLSRIRRRITKG